MGFKNSEADLKTIGEALDVGVILEGSVRKSGNELRITAQPLNAEDGFHLWSETYDRELGDIAVTTQAGATPPPYANFEGLSDDDNNAVAGFQIVPPDSNGDVGPSHYVQYINSIFAVWDKTNPGAGPIFGPVPGNLFWQGFGGICESNNDGDPIVLYDHLADRWIASQFALGNDGHQCVAVSTTGDPTGSYHRYDFVVSANAWNDYPKLGVWPDAYYMSINEWSIGFQDFRGVYVFAFERDKMLDGDPAARFVRRAPGPSFSLQPSHLEGPPPPEGTPNTFIMAFDDEVWGAGFGPDGYRLWDFSVDWNTEPPTASLTFLGLTETDEFDARLCDFGPCVPQPHGGELLDTLGAFTMYRAQFRHFLTHDSIVVNHTVDVDGNNLAGVRWAELRRGAGSWMVHQTGTFAPNDGNHRWMGSIAMDEAGNIALGYSVSSENTFPSIRYATRSADDPLGLLNAEFELIAGGGSQYYSFNRWGDYSSMSVDPVDDCTFWYTQEYYPKNGTFDWKTRVGAFKMPTCACTPTEDPEISCTDGIDNDCNTFIDCGDSSCNGDRFCETCTLGRRGDPCTSDADCCSQKCRGREGETLCRG